jgi:transcriptional regulator with XRE-family HTH domain
MRSVFGELLRHAIVSKNTSISGWAQRVGCTHGQISNIIAGRRSPPLEQLDRWCAELGLADQARERFVNLAYLAHAPEQVRALVERLEARVEGAEREVGVLRSQLEAAHEQLKRLRRADAIAQAKEHRRVAEGPEAPASENVAHAATSG